MTTGSRHMRCEKTLYWTDEFSALCSWPPQHSFPPQGELWHLPPPPQTCAPESPPQLWHRSRNTAKPWRRSFCKPRRGYDPSVQFISSKILTCCHLKRWRGLRKEQSHQQTPCVQGKHQGPRLGWGFPTWHSHSPHEKLKVGTSWLSCAMGQVPRCPPSSRI